MTSDFHVRATDSLPVNIKAQLNAIHNPAFPFSSPILDDHRSIDSLPTGISAQSERPFESPLLTVSSISDDEVGHGSPEHASRRLKKGDNSRADTRDRASSTSPSGKRRTPGLQLITDFSKPTYHASNLVLDQVQARRTEKSQNRAHSVVSQKGVKISLSPQSSRRQVFPGLGELVEATNRKRRVAIQSPDRSTNSSAKRQQRSPSQKSILIGLCVSEHEAEFHNQGKEIDSAVTLFTPATPVIILTPPDEDSGADKKEQFSKFVTKPQRRPASSVYSTVTLRHDAKFKDQILPPVPLLPTQIDAQPTVLQSRNPFRNLPQVDTAACDNRVDPTRYSEDSKEHILADSCDTARPKSQGWWNVLLSPLLSRTGSVASRKGKDDLADAPPVPPIPPHIGKVSPVSAICTDPSPETPRRLGLASARTSTWSRWTEWEEERDQAKGQQYEVNQHIEAAPVALEETLHVPVDPVIHHRRKGLAAEYYHACSIEQLSNVTYFDCINHSCVEHLPELKSIYDPPIGYLTTLGSPFATKTNNESRTISEKEAKDDKESDPVTPIDSDEEVVVSPPTKQRNGSSNKKSPATPIESDSEPDELSPNIRKANTAAVVRARALGSPGQGPLPPYTRNIGFQELPNISAVVPPPSQPQISLPQPISSMVQRPLAPPVAAPMTVYQTPSTEPRRMFVNNQTSYPGLPARPTAAPVKVADLRIEQRTRKTIEKKRQSREKEKVKARGVGCLCCGRGRIPKNRCFGRGGQEGRKKRRWCIAIAITLILIIVLCIILATQLVHRRGNTPIQSQWLNLTGYPPVPTGISTIAQPSLTQSQSGCIQPNTMWSCALPKEDQASIAPNDPNQPNFRFQIAFRNGTVPANMTIPITKRASDPFANDQFVPNPSPPSQADQAFLGSTTDNVTQPFDGEQTPFFITFMSVTPVVPSTFNTSQQISARDLQNNIPAPALAADGSAAPASLLPTAPFPISQPIKLYNRGLQDEHFGFYMYYDKSIFLSGVAIANSSAANKILANGDADQNGGSDKNIANVRCTLAQTRFLVKMFTNPRFEARLLTRPSNSTTTVTSSDISRHSTANSSATDFIRPGSFPYPTTIVLDRHGGNINTKLTFCYGMTNGQINVDEKQLVFEERSFGGNLVNPAPSLISDGSNDGFNSSLGGIDGGTGGCGCMWQNWS